MRMIDLKDGMVLATMTSDGKIFKGTYVEVMMYATKEVGGYHESEIPDGYIPVLLQDSDEITLFKLSKTLGVL